MVQKERIDRMMEYTTRDHEGDPTFNTSLDLRIPEDAWEPVGRDDGDPWARILTTIWINGCPMHLEGVAVEPGPDGIQNAADPEFEDTLGALAAIDCPDGPWQTVTLESVDARTYVLHAEPF